jgi:hypothetical protein
MLTRPIQEIGAAADEMPTRSLAIERRLRDRTGVMAERAATKSRKGGITAAGSSWIPEDKRLSKVFSKTEICVT